MRTRKEINDEIEKLIDELESLPTRWGGHKFPSIFFIWCKGDSTLNNNFRIIESPDQLVYYEDKVNWIIRPANKNEVLNLFDDFEGAKNTEQLLQPENGPVKCANNGCAGWDNGFCAVPGLCREWAVSG